MLAGLARCYQEAGEQETAKRLYDELLAQQPNHAMALTGWAKLAMFEGRLEEAESSLRRALAVDPSLGEAHYSLYLCLVRAGKTREAERQRLKLSQVKHDLHRIFELMNREIPQRPHDPKLLCETGIISLRYGELEAGLHWLYSALKYDPRYRDAHSALADYYERTGDHERASQHHKFASVQPEQSKEAGHGK